MIIRKYRAVLRGDAPEHVFADPIHADRADGDRSERATDRDFDTRSGGRRRPRTAPIVTIIPVASI